MKTLDDLDNILARLEALVDSKSKAGMTRVGIRAERALGVSIPNLRALGKEIGKNHDLAQQLWQKGLRETMILAGLVDRPRDVTPEQMDAWVLDFHDWEVCDQTIGNLFRRTPHAWDKAMEWSRRPEEFVRRAGFVLMAGLAVSDKKADDRAFDACWPLIVEFASDERNMVKKAVNWALRQIGKRNMNLNERAVEVAREIQTQDSSSARWIASDALRELTGEKVRKRLRAE